MQEFVLTKGSLCKSSEFEEKGFSSTEETFVKAVYNNYIIKSYAPLHHPYILFLNLSLRIQHELCSDIHQNIHFMLS